MKLLKMILNWIKRLFSRQQKSKEKQIIEPLKIDMRTNTQKRNDFLKSKGYSVNTKRKSEKVFTKPKSNYRSYILKFIENKYNKYVVMTIKPYRNKYGFPFYTTRIIKNS